MSIDEKAKKCKRIFSFGLQTKHIFKKKQNIICVYGIKKSLRINFKIHPEGQQEH